MVCIGISPVLVFCIPFITPNCLLQVSKAPFDFFAEKEEDYNQRYMMNFEELKHFVMQLLDNLGYCTEYNVGPNEKLEEGRLSVTLHIPLARTGRWGGIVGNQVPLRGILE